MDWCVKVLMCSHPSLLRIRFVMDTVGFWFCVGWRIECGIWWNLSSIKLNFVCQVVQEKWLTSDVWMK